MLTITPANSIMVTITSLNEKEENKGRLRKSKSQRQKSWKSIFARETLLQHTLPQIKSCTQFVTWILRENFNRIRLQVTYCDFLAALVFWLFNWSVLWSSFEEGLPDEQLFAHGWLKSLSLMINNLWERRKTTLFIQTGWVRSSNNYALLSHNAGSNFPAYFAVWGADTRNKC